MSDDIPYMVRHYRHFKVNDIEFGDDYVRARAVAQALAAFGDERVNFIGWNGARREWVVFFYKNGKLNIDNLEDR